MKKATKPYRKMPLFVMITVLLVTTLQLRFCLGMEENTVYDGEASVSLNQGWLGWNENKKQMKFTANVPFTIHTAIMREGYIDDPYYRFNDKLYRWVSLDSWVITNTFYVPETFLLYKKINVVFRGLDTVASIYLNGMNIGNVSNKFIEHVFDVKRLLKSGSPNVLKVVFASAIQYAKKQSENYKQKFNYSVLPDCYPEVLHGECHSNFIRKEPCSFGWDFGPSFPTQGILESVFLQGWSSIDLKDVLVQTEKSNDGTKWVLFISLYIDSMKAKKTIFLSYHIIEADFKKKYKTLLHDNENKIVHNMKIQNSLPIKLWWPNGYGDQTMYSLEITMLDSNYVVLGMKTVRFGFRTVELVQEPITGSHGLSFYFKINSLPIFLKGSNWVPADAFRDRVTNDVIDEYLHAAKEANMNVLRVWGGGGYEHDYFYEACDRLGLMIWHDLMFACAMYPTDATFINSIQREVSYQVRRLQPHPSIIIWSANNENEVALRENWYGTSKKFETYKRDYIKLYVDNIRVLVANIDKSRPFIVSSPSDGLESEAEGWIAKDPRSPYYGDVHVYNYTANCWDVDIYPKARFASEYGYQSYPSFETLSKIALPKDLYWNSTLMMYRQHHQDGNSQIQKMVAENFGLPSSHNSTAYFEQMIFMSQIVQAMCITFETEHYRRYMGRLEECNDETSTRNGVDLQGFTMGAMYWQLNDVWQAPSWSSIEYGGKRKMLHYYAKSLFAPLVTSAYVKNGSVIIFIVSDFITYLDDVTLQMTVYNWSSFTAIRTMQSVHRIQAQSSTHIATINVRDLCKVPVQCFLLLHITVANHPSLDFVRPVFLSPFSHGVKLKDPKLTIGAKEMVKIGDRIIHFVLRAFNPAAFVWLSTKFDGHFSDNGFLMYASSRSLNFTSKHALGIMEFSASLRCVSLFDVYGKSYN